MVRRKMAGLVLLFLAFGAGLAVLSGWVSWPLGVEGIAPEKEPGQTPELAAIAQNKSGKPEPDFRPQPLGPDEPIPPEIRWYTGTIQGIENWRDRELRKGFGGLDRADKRLKDFFPLIRAESLAQENLVTEALESLRERARQLQRERLAWFAAPRNFEKGLLLLRLGILMVLVEEKEGRQFAQEGIAIFRDLAQKNLSGTVEPWIDGELQIAKALLQMQHPAEAKEHLEAAWGLCQKYRQTLGENQTWTRELAYHQALTEVYETMGNHEAALKQADKTIAQIGAVPTWPLLLLRAATEASKGRSLVVLGRDIEAKPLLENALKVFNRGAKVGDLRVGIIHRNLAELALLQSDPAKAQHHLEEAVRIYERGFPGKNYPNGHPLLFQVRLALASLLNELGHPETADKLTASNLEQCEKLYPQPHPLRLTILLTHSETLRLLGKADQARELASQARDLVTKIPDELGGTTENRERWRVSCLLQMSFAHWDLKQWEQVQRCLDEATPLSNRLYPEGHLQRTRPLLLQARLALLREDYEKAYEGFQSLLKFHEKQLLQFESRSSAAEAMVFGQQRQVCVAGLLSACRHLPRRQSEVYARVWADRHATMRLLQERRQSIRSALSKNPALQKIAAQLTDLRGQIARELAEVHGIRSNLSEEADLDKKQRDLKLARLYADVGYLEAERRRLSGGEKVPDKFGPAELAEQLPEGTAFMDFIRYEDQTDARKPQRYVAFLILPRQAPRWIDLGLAEPIDERVQGWREAVSKTWPETPRHEPEGRKIAEAEAGAHAAFLSQVVWKPLHQQCPAARTIYLALDGSLCGFPFVVLPTPGAEKERILLEEDLVIGYVPHGTALLELSASAPWRELDPLLLLSQLDYGQAPANREAFAPLESGTRVAERIRALAGKRPVFALNQKNATIPTFQQQIKKAKVAYLATHGYFLEEAWKNDRARWKSSLQSWTLKAGPTPGALAMGRRSLLGYTGLALSGANLDKAGEGLLTGEMIAELDLAELKLAILSACDTGLGEYAIGEGVQGVQQAFHLAGCPNVLAALWCCAVQPTDDLLEEFCRQLWQGNNPLLALRAAQRAIYLHPERESIQAVFQSGHALLPKRTPVYLWAGLVLSGPGQ